MAENQDQKQNGEQDRIAEARKIAREKAGFIRHFIIYIVVIAFLAVINNVTSSGYQWWLWPALGWGIGVVLNFFSAYLFHGKGLEERIMKSELDKMDGEK
ncbi:MAG: 2TM domain-containing protein [Spirochaetia bacterium]